MEGPIHHPSNSPAPPLPVRCTRGYKTPKSGWKGSGRRKGTCTSQSLCVSLSHTLSLSLTHTLSRTYTLSLTHTHALTLTHSLSLTHTRSVPVSDTHNPFLVRCTRGYNTQKSGSKGSGRRKGTCTARPKPSEKPSCGARSSLHPLSYTRNSKPDTRTRKPKSEGHTYTLHPTPYTLHPTPYTLHPTPYTLHPKPCTLHPTPYILHARGEVRCHASWQRGNTTFLSLQTPHPTLKP